MNRRNFFRNVLGAVLIGMAQPLGKLESCLKINSRPVVVASEDLVSIHIDNHGMYLPGKFTFPIVNAPYPKLRIGKLV